MKNWIGFGFFVTAFLILIVVGAFLSQKDLVLKDEAVVKKIPVSEMRITLDGVNLDEIKENSKEIKYSGNRLDIGDLSFDDVEIKGRGNATWLQDKKPYQLKLSQKADLLGLGKQRKWILVSSYWDDTNLRTDTAFYLERMVGEEFAYSGEFVELYVDDGYEGLYYLTRGISIDKNAVGLKDPLGVLVELDNIYGGREDDYFFTSNGECLTIKDVVTEDNKEVAMIDFIKSFNALEKAIKKQDFEKIREIIDVQSFAQYYLISEFSANSDAYFTSQFFYKDGSEDKIHAGPAWDFDIAFNNTNVRNQFSPDDDMTKNISTEYFNDPTEQYMQWSRLFARLIKMPEFETEVERVFQERMMGRKAQFLEHIIGRAAKIYSAALRDSEKWGKGDYLRDVKRLLEWVNIRYEHFEAVYGAKKHKKYPIYDINIIEI